MLINIEPLRKILELEQKKGYVDTAVIGGLDKFFHNWADRAVELVTSPPLLKRFQHLVNTSYASLTKQQRKEWVNSAVEFIDDFGSFQMVSGDSSQDVCMCNRSNEVIGNIYENPELLKEKKQ